MGSQLVNVAGANRFMRSLARPEDSPAMARFLEGGTHLAPIGGMVLPLHPHNGPLQVWLELGGIGVLFFLALLWKGVVWIVRLPEKKLRGGYGAFYGSALVFCSITLSLWQSWWVCLDL